MLTPEQSAQLQEVLTRTAERIIALEGWNRNCLSCVHFSEGSDTCLKWGMKPPARVILGACPSFEAHPF